MHLRILQSLGEEVNHTYLVSVVKSKIPKEIMERLEIEKGEDSWAMYLLRKRVQIHLSAKEEADRLANPQSQNEPRRTPLKTLFDISIGPSRNFNYRGNKGFSTTSAFATNPRIGRSFISNSNYPQSGKKCFYCQGNQFADECKKFSTLDTNGSIKRKLPSVH